MPPRRLLTILASLLVAGCADTLQTDRALIESGKTQEGLARLAADTQKSPQDVSLRQYYYSAREAAVTRWLAQAKSALASGDSKQAAAMLDEVERADPHNPQAAALRHELAQGQGSDADLKAAQAAFAAKHYDEAEATLKARLQRVPQDAASRELMDKIRAERTQAAAQTALDPEYGKGKVSLEFQNAPLRSVFDVLSRQSGLSFAFAPGVPLDRPLTIFAKEIPIAEAITMLVEGNQLTRRALNSHTLLIGTEVPPPPPEPVGSGEVVHAFYLTNADAKQVASLLQSLIPFKNLDVDDSLNLLLVRGNAAQVASAARLISLVDLAQPEVMLEVEVLEVGSDLVRNLGIQYPNQFTLLNVPPSASSVTTPTGTTVTTPSPTPLTVESLLHISADKIAINNPALNLRDDLGKVKLLANPQIRVKNRNDAHVQIGEKVPVFTSSLTPTGVVSNSVSYLDVGLKLDVKPQVLLDDNVQIKLTLEVSSILNQVNNNGTLAYQIGTRNADTTLRLADNETQILAGLISDQDRSSANRVPGLGEIPLLGRLFSNNLDSHSRTEIILLITPHVLRNLDLAKVGQIEFPVGQGGAPALATASAYPHPASPAPVAPGTPPVQPPAISSQPVPLTPPNFKLPPGMAMPPGMQTGQ